MIPVTRNAVKPKVYLAHPRAYQRPAAHHHYHRHYHQDTYTKTNHYAAPKNQPKGRMKSKGTQTSEADFLTIPPHERGTWKGFFRKQYMRMSPTVRWVGLGLVFLASRINLGIGYRLNWLPFLGTGLP